MNESKELPMTDKYPAGSYFISEMAEEKDNFNIVLAGPFKTMHEAKRTLKGYKGSISHPVIFKIVGSYQNWAMGNAMFSNKLGLPLPDNKEMKVR
jgi:hypothetical protein